MFPRRFQFTLRELGLCITLIACALAIMFVKSESMYVPLQLLGFGIIGSGVRIIASRRSFVERIVNGFMFGAGIYVILLVVGIILVGVFGFFPAQD